MTANADLPMPSGKSLVMLPIAAIRPHRNNPRKRVDPEELDNLAKSIEVEGIDEPLRVCAITDDPQHSYEIIAGNRRLEAARMNGHATVEVLIVPIKNAYDHDLKSIRSNSGIKLSPMDCAFVINRVKRYPEFLKDPVKGMARLREAFGVGDSPRGVNWIKQREVLVKLAPDVQELVDARGDAPRLTVAVAAKLAQTFEDDPEVQSRLAHDIVNRKPAMPAAKALQYINAEAQKYNMAPTTPRANGRDPVATVISAITRCQMAISRIGELDGPEFEQALKKRVTEERTAFTDLIRISIAQLRQLNDVISNS